MERKNQLIDNGDGTATFGDREYLSDSFKQSIADEMVKKELLEHHNDIAWVTDEIPSADMTDDCRDSRIMKEVEETQLGLNVALNPLSLQEGGDHYKKYKIQPIEYCHANNLNACETYAIKYITRHKDKGGILDINKAIHCLELLKELEYEHRPGSTETD